MSERTDHHYFGVNLDIVWQVVTSELPPVIVPLAEMLDDEGS